MPVQYEGVRPEHVAVRTGCGVFDVSHMGEIETVGPGAAGLLQRLLSNDLARLDVGGAQYSVLCRDDGGVLDDLFTYRLAEDRFLTVTNAANHQGDLAWFNEHAGGFEADVTDAIDDYAMLAVQGPGARDLCGGLVAGELPARMRTASVPLGAALRRTSPPSSAGPATPARTGSRSCASRPRPRRCGTRSSRPAPRRRASAPATPCGSRSASTSTGTTSPPTATRSRPGSAGAARRTPGSSARMRSRPSARPAAEAMLVPFALTEKGIPRQGNQVLAGETVVGEVTSGTLSPCLDRGIGMAYVEPELAEAGTEIEIDVRGRRRPARIESKPLYRKPS